MISVIGQAVDRVDGRLKVTGGAKYAADYTVNQIAHGVPVQSSIARGRVVNIDTSAAERSPGVLAVITQNNAPTLRKPKNDFGSATKLGEERGLFEDDHEHYAGQYLAIVVAESLEEALTAAGLVRVEMDEQPPALEMDQGEKFQPADDFAKTNLRTRQCETRAGILTLPVDPDVYDTGGASQPDGTLGVPGSLGRQQADSLRGHAMGGRSSQRGRRYTGHAARGRAHRLQLRWRRIRL